MFENLQSQVESALASGSYGFALMLVFLAGIGTSLTPCVYPMIAITVSVFGARQAKSRWEGAKLSTAFVLGIAALFTPLGLGAAVTGGVFGAALANPIILVGLALLFCALAASMFGAFEMNLPPAFQNRIASSGGVGVRGAFALGLASSLIAAPCTGPVLGFLLTWVGTSGNVAFGGLALFVYSLGLGLLTWCVGTFSISLPKSGRWLEWVKSVFGIVMIVAAVYYVRDLIPGLSTLASKTPAFLGVSVALVVLGIAAGAIHLTFHHAPVVERVRKGIGVLLATLGALGVVGYALALPEGAHIEWTEGYEAAKTRAVREGKPLLVDFGASWCVACGELDQLTFSDSRVVAESRRFVAVRVDLSPGKDTDANRAALASYSQRGLPLVVMHTPSGSEALRITEFVDAERFLTALRQVR